LVFHDSSHYFLRYLAYKRFKHIWHVPTEIYQCRNQSKMLKNLITFYDGCDVVVQIAEFRRIWCQHLRFFSTGLRAPHNLRQSWRISGRNQSRYWFNSNKCKPNYLLWTINISTQDEKSVTLPRHKFHGYIQNNKFYCKLIQSNLYCLKQFLYYTIHYVPLTLLLVMIFVTISVNFSV